MTTKGYPDTVMVMPMAARDITKMLPVWLGEAFQAIWKAGESPGVVMHLNVAFNSIAMRDGRSTRQLHSLFQNDRFYAGEMHQKAIFLLSAKEFSAENNLMRKILNYIIFAAAEDSYSLQQHNFLLDGLQATLAYEIKQALKENRACS